MSNKSSKFGPKPYGVNKFLICLTDKAEADLKFVTGYMQVSQSEAIRMGLQLAAKSILSDTENTPKCSEVQEA